MPKILKLTKPIPLDGQEVRELPYDFDALTAADIHETSRYLKANGVAVPLSPAVDVDFQLGLFARAVGAAEQDFHFADALRLSALDAMTAATLTQIFFLGEGGEEPSDSSGR